MAEKEKKEGVFYELEVLAKQGANMLMSSIKIAGLSEFHAPVVEQVWLASKEIYNADGVSTGRVFDPDNGDIYPHDDEKNLDKKKYRFHKQAYMKLANCAGFIWSPTLSRRTDNGADPNYVAYSATGGIRKADGQPYFETASYDVDLLVIEEELMELYTKKAKWRKTENPGGKGQRDATDEEKQDYINYCVKRDLLQKRKNKLKSAESGAKCRVVHNVLRLENTYTKADLAEPFVMVRIVFRLDYNDPDVKRQLVAAAVQSMTGIYGPQSLDNTVRESAPIDITPIPEEKEDCPPDDKPMEDMSPADKQALDFSASDADERVKTLMALAKLKAYDVQAYLKKAGLASVSSMVPEKQVDFFKHLLTLADKKDLDIPF